MWCSGFGAAGASHDSPRAQTCTFEGSAFKNTTKIQREDPQRGKKRTNFPAGEGKKERNFGRSWGRAILEKGRSKGRAVQGKGGPGCLLGGVSGGGGSPGGEVSGGRSPGGLRWVSGGSLENPLPCNPPLPFDPLTLSFSLQKDKNQKENINLGFKGEFEGV